MEDKLLQGIAEADTFNPNLMPFGEAIPGGVNSPLLSYPTPIAEILLETHSILSARWSWELDMHRGSIA